MKSSEFNGSPETIGLEYGKAFYEAVRKNMDVLVKRTSYAALPLDDPDCPGIWAALSQNII